MTLLYLRKYFEEMNCLGQMRFVTAEEKNYMGISRYHVYLNVFL
ncbi:hypothetical protein T4A_7099 [Trichinella pseudospiralis]|uniref:Uncharacterized protein n=1 Tax=Trichinella pseudospiralis TaxID=6337 RepID=A0A0V1DVZ8_TRIPS|nr:hypothetical protein T4A_7099 [Trichinella pseudospiralis]